MRTPLLPIWTFAVAMLAGIALTGNAAVATDSGMTYKIIVPDHERFSDEHLELLEDYGHFALYRARTPSLRGREGEYRALDRADILEFSAHPIDTRAGVEQAPPGFQLHDGQGAGLYAVQFIGPVRSSWLEELRGAGAVPIHYIANYGYLLWIETPAAARQLSGLGRHSHWLQYTTPLHGFLKVDSRLLARIDSAQARDDTEVDVTVQVYDHPGAEATRQYVQALARPPADGTPHRWSPILDYQNLRLRVRVADIPMIAQRPDVTFVGETLQMRLMDERQNLLMMGDFSPGASSIDYLQYLRDLGFTEDHLAYPIVDITDTPVHEGGTGVTVVDTADPKLRVGGEPAGVSRVAAFTNCGSQPDDQVGDGPGHGSINAGIVAGYDARSDWPYQDALGHRLGLGINPFGRVASTAIFSPGWDIAGCADFAGIIESNWRSGARISNNAWGTSQPPVTYEEGQQIYDAGVRDADPEAEFNQQMIYIFSAGNLGSGAYTVASPAAAKNVIAVGASENVRPDWVDGCGAGPDDADNANDVARFSSRGPTRDGRVKPETIAPGTHIQGGASNYTHYVGNGVCDMYYPPGQSEFASSSGTSHSAPAVAGLASLAYWWIEQGGAGDAEGSVDLIDAGQAPSPALMKAWLMAHPLYLDGVASGDTLPSVTQGYGMPDIKTMFDTTPKVLVDQSEVFVETGEIRRYRWAVADPAQPVRVALAYTDAPGMLGTSPQVNDLDLQVSSAGQTWLGNQFDGAWSVSGGQPDPLNNYEAVFLPAGSVDDVIITVVASNIAGDGVNAGHGPSQDFALVCYNCVREPGFTVESEQMTVRMCAGETAETEILVGQIADFTDPVMLAAQATVPGLDAVFQPNPSAPGSISALSLTAPEATAVGQYSLTVSGDSGDQYKALDLTLDVYQGKPNPATLVEPGDGGQNIDLQPTLRWQPQTDAYSYRVQVAADPGFNRVVAQTETTATEWALDYRHALDSSRTYWWRVIARNPCGDSAEGLPAPGADLLFRDAFEPADAPPVDDAQTFVTRTLPLDCAIDEPPVTVFSDPLESGAPGWATGASGVSLWTLGGAARSGQWAWQATAPDAGSGNDQWLVSPAIALPEDLGNLRLQFWQQQALKSGATGCQDGALLEVSSNDGGTWNQVFTGLSMLPYDGAISGAYQNPLGGRQAWCGDPRGYRRTIVDLTAYAGQTVKFRFRLGHDRFEHRDGVNWAIDDVVVTGCPNAQGNPP